MQRSPGRSRCVVAPGKTRSPCTCRGLRSRSCRESRGWCLGRGPLVRGWGGARLFWGLRSGSAGSNNVSHRRPPPAFLTGDRTARPGLSSVGERGA